MRQSPHEIFVILAFSLFSMGAVLLWAWQTSRSYSYALTSWRASLTRTCYSGTPRYHLASPAPQITPLLQANTPEQNRAYFASVEHQTWRQLAGITGD